MKQILVIILIWLTLSGCTETDSGESTQTATERVAIATSKPIDKLEPTATATIMSTNSQFADFKTTFENSGTRDV